jgi:hypothetical protein
MLRKRKKPRGKPFEKGDPRAGRPKGTPNKATAEIRDLARSLLSRPGYLRHMERQLDEGKLPPPILVMLHHYAYGKPKETVEHTTSTEGLLHKIELVLVNG